MEQIYDKSNRPWQGIRDGQDEVGGTHGSQCNDCAYRWPSGLSCDAFPSGIPIDVIADAVVHDHPLPELGQRNKVVYAKVGTVDDTLYEQMNGKPWR